MTELPNPILGRYSAAADQQWRSLLMAFFLRRTHSRCESEDLTQESLMRVARVCDLDNAGARFYLFKTATNLLRDRARRANTHQAKAHQSLSGAGPDSMLFPAEECNPERVLIGKEALQTVHSALGELDERTRDIFILFRLEKLKHREIASRFGISVSAVEKHVVKATAHLLARLDINE
jgi:RNA polymerase sigma factor (sigma-70 family)